MAPGSGWRTVTIPTTSNGGLDMAATRAFTLQLYGGPSQDINGQITLLLDNVRLTNRIPEPSSLAIAALCGLGLVSSRRR